MRALPPVIGALVDSALACLDRGWVPVRVAGKVPIGGDGWNKLRPTREEVTNWRGCNLGVLLGAASGGLVDIDLDCPEAIELAPFYLPPTWIYGRASKPDSHRLYIAAGVYSKQFEDLDGAMMLEIRGNSREGDGIQSVIPPSVHVSGERIEWNPDYCDGTDGPREIDAGELISAVCRLARATLLVRHGASVEQARAEVAAHRPQPRRRRSSGGNSPPKRDAAKLKERARNYLAKLPPAISKQGGHKALFKAAIAMCKGFELDESTALDLLRQDYNPRCQPAWSERELEHKVKHAADRSHVPAGYLLGERGA